LPLSNRPQTGIALIESALRVVHSRSSVMRDTDLAYLLS
jgi:hypothetical protein